MECRPGAVYEDSTEVLLSLNALYSLTHAVRQFFKFKILKKIAFE